MSRIALSLISLTSIALISLSAKAEVRSKVPKREGPFSSTLEAQRNELASDPLVVRFKKARDKHKKDPPLSEIPLPRS